MRKLTSGRSIFLFELAILLLFFIVSIVICVSLFVFSNNKNAEANDLNSATIKAITIADTLKACKTNLPQARQLLGANKEFQIYYDSDWGAGKGRDYLADVVYELKDNLLTASIRFTRCKDGKPIYSLEVKEFLGEERK